MALSAYLGLFKLDDSYRTLIPMFPRAQTVAALRYEFEIFDGSLNGSGSPVTMGTVVMPFVNGRSLNERTWVFTNPLLLDLITRNAHRVDELLLVAKARKTQDPGILEELLDAPSYPALITGRL
jgi:hypothetical protein